MARGILLGDQNGRGRRMLLPPGAMRELQSSVISTCLVPTGDGKVCGQKFYRGQERKVEQHALTCTRRHEAETRETSEQLHPEIMRPWDPEFARWMRVNKDAVLSGRMKV